MPKGEKLGLTQLDRTIHAHHHTETPTIAFFPGIAIRMVFNDHDPPHFHAYRGGREAKFDIETGRMIDGKMT